MYLPFMLQPVQKRGIQSKIQNMDLLFPAISKSIESKKGSTPPLASEEYGTRTEYYLCVRSDATLLVFVQVCRAVG